MYSSLFKQDVKITQAYKGSTHKGLDLSTGKVEQPVYLPLKAVEGYVHKILAGYTYDGKYYKDSPIIYIKHKDGSGSRYIHSYPRNVKVKVGDTIQAGAQVCATGNSGYSFGDHLHFEWLKKWDDLGSHTDPVPYLTLENNPMFKIGDRIEFLEVQNIRSGSGTDYPVSSQTTKGMTATIIGGPRVANGYTWWDIRIDNGGTGWTADVEKFKIYVPPVIPPVDPIVDLKKEITALKTEISRLTEALRASQGALKMAEERVEVLEGNLELRDKELKEVEIELDRVTEERNRFEAEKNELLATGTVAGATTKEIFAELWKRITRSIK